MRLHTSIGPINFMSVDQKDRRMMIKPHTQIVVNANEFDVMMQGMDNVDKSLFVKIIVV